MITYDQLANENKELCKQLADKDELLEALKKKNQQKRVREGALPYGELENLYRNALEELATERQKLREEHAKFHGDDYPDMDAARNRILDLEAELAAEREKLAEVEDHNIRGVIHPDALARHEQQLTTAVEALKKIRKQLECAPNSFGLSAESLIVDAALAKLKGK